MAHQAVGTSGARLGASHVLPSLGGHAIIAPIWQGRQRGQAAGPGSHCQKQPSWDPLITKGVGGARGGQSLAMWDAKAGAAAASERDAASMLCNTYVPPTPHGLTAPFEGGSHDLSFSFFRIQTPLWGPTLQASVHLLVCSASPAQALTHSEMVLVLTSAPLGSASIVHINETTNSCQPKNQF